MIEAKHVDAPRILRAHPEDEIERRGLAGAVRADERVDGAGRHRQVDRPGA